jgi:hypothetical protein
MSREDRRRFEREFKKIRKSDNCTICSKPFPHNTRTFGGITSNGSVVFAGECCARQVLSVMHSTLYVTKSIDLLGASGKPDARKPSNGPVNVDQALSDMQLVISKIDARTDALMRQAGIPNDLKGVFMGEHAWKADDAAWFKNHPERSHRLRPLLDGEAEAMPVPIPTSEFPRNHRAEVLVRQVVPGQRIRKLFGRNMEVDIPDQEEIIHALFDAVVSAVGGSIIDIREIIERAKQYANSRAQPLN